MFLLSAAFAASRPKEWIIGVGFVELSALLEKRPARVFWIPVPHRFDRLVKRIFKAVAKTGSSQVEPGRKDFDPQECRNIGSRFRLLFFEFGLCQYGNIEPAPALRSLVRPTKHKLVAREHALDALQQAGLETQQYGFVHIRLGDYVQFKIKGESPVLPAEWYLRQTKELLRRVPNLPLVVLSDDTARARSLFPEAGLNLTFLELGTSESFHVMQNACAGVLSASTFSWWGARLASGSAGGPFIAPQFWMGFRTGEWFPSERIISDFLEYEVVPIC